MGAEIQLQPWVWVVLSEMNPVSFFCGMIGMLDAEAGIAVG